MNPVVEKARKINNSPEIYGSFAEIGAGQEVARYFFLAGRASQTIAKTMSAYDMVFSDEIYGKEESGRYVCHSRLKKMLEKEYSLLERRLGPLRGNQTCFFSFADTVATGDGQKKHPHGWMGVRFQGAPKEAPSEVIIHVRLLDKFRLHQQESLGVLGVNLIEAAFYGLTEPKKLLSRLVENLKPGQVAIDLIRMDGPRTAHINTRLINLELVKMGLSEAVLFDADGEIQPLSDILYQKAVLVQRGIYKPVTNTHLEIFKKGTEQFKKDNPTIKDLLPIFEITMGAKNIDDPLIEKDFLDRVMSLNSLGFPVMVSNFSLFYRLKKHLRNYTQDPLVIIMGASHLDKLFDESAYQDLEGHWLEGLGRLFDSKTRVYVYPHKQPDLCTTAATFSPLNSGRQIYKYFLENQFIKDISGCDEASEYIHSKDVQLLIQKGDPKWKDLVPVNVREQMIQKNLFGLLP